MVVDVLYDGVLLQGGAQARDEGDGVFIELEAPMPVGSRVKVRGPDGERAARVERVREGAGAGMLVKFVEGGGDTGEHEAITDGDAGDKKKKKKKKGN